MIEESFRSLIQRLTEPHPVSVEIDDVTTYQQADGLLTRLRAAVFADMEGDGGGGGGFGSRPPLDPGAVDLLQEIERQATEALAAATGTPTPYGRAEDYVRAWAELVDEEKRVVVTSPATSTDDARTVYQQRHEFTAHALAAHWVRRVEEFFKPPKIRPIQAPCPDCGSRFVARSKDGEVVQANALSIYFTDDGRVDLARCAVCGSEWWPGSFVDVLAPAIGANPIPELVKPTPE